jgi:hypothetical protein
MKEKKEWEKYKKTGSKQGKRFNTDGYFWPRGDQHFWICNIHIIVFSHGGIARVS